MSQIELGKLLTDGKEIRDAVHVAVMSAIAGHGLRAGDRVGVVDFTTVPVTVGDVLFPIGIVDPFLTGYVPRGEKCLVLMMPHTVANMRHQWDLATPINTPDVVSASVSGVKVLPTQPTGDEFHDDSHSQWCRDEDC